MIKKNKSIQNINELKNVNNINKFESTEKLISYGEFKIKYPNATKKQRCEAIKTFYKILLS